MPRHGSARRTFHKSSGSESFLALRRLLCARSPLSRDGPFLRAFPVSTCLVVPFCSLASPFEKLQREPELKFVRTLRRGAAPHVNRRPFALVLWHDKPAIATVITDDDCNSSLASFRR